MTHSHHRVTTRRRWSAAAALLAALVVGIAGQQVARAATPSTPGPVQQAFQSAAARFGVPAPLLEAVCYLEGRFGDHGGTASIDGGYGCMHLVRNHRVDTLDQAAGLLHTSADALRGSLPQNIAGGAAVLAAQAQTSGAAPSTLADWYAPVAQYSAASTDSVRELYADAVFRLLDTGFSGVAEDGEQLTVPPQHVTPNRALAPQPAALPAGCSTATGVDYPGAVNCIVPAASYDCNVTSPCTYQSANRPTDYAINDITVHDVEGTALDALAVFQDRNSGVSAHYVVDTDGTVYQVIHEKDIGYHAGNFYYNEHAVGIEHAGYDATGYQWYNATEYLASAKLVAYLLTKYGIPLDRGHVQAHGTTPAPTTGTSPNHVDPGPYWLWDYYFGLIHAQGVPYPTGTAPAGSFTLAPSTDQTPDGANGAETSANFNFFTLHTSASSTSPVIPNANCAGDVTDETCNVEPGVSYYAVASQPDAAGTGMTMYEVWYGENDRLHNSSPSQLADAKLAWIAVPAGAAVPAIGSVVQLNGTKAVNIYGRPTASNTYVIGSAPGGARFSAPRRVIADGSTTAWYVIDFNHRQAWVPASAVTVIA
jgi:hypothetical protein